jgi:hypothetical protein
LVVLVSSVEPLHTVGVEVCGHDGAVAESPAAGAASQSTVAATTRP